MPSNMKATCGRGTNISSYSVPMRAASWSIWLARKAMTRSSRRKVKAEAVRTIKAWQGDTPDSNEWAAAIFHATAGDWQLNTRHYNSVGSGDFGGFV